MKKSIVLVLLCVSSFGFLRAQGVSGGIKGGLNLASQNLGGGGISIDTKAKAGVHFGVYATIMFSENLGLQPELLYSAQGTKFDIAGAGDAAYKFNYINIPILLRYNLNSIVNLHAGPQFGILASAKADDGDTEEDIKEFVKASDISAALGLGVDLPAGLNFTVRYSLGLSDLDEENDSEIKNNNIQISVGYRIFGKKK